MLSKSAWAIVEYLQNPLLILITTPLFLGYLGPEKFGIWVFFLSVNSIGGYFAAGLIQSLTKKVSADNATKQRALHEESSTGASLVALTNLVIIFFVVMAYFMYLGSEALSDELWPAFLFFLLLSLIFDQLDAIMTGFLRGFEKFSATAKVELAGRICQYTLSIALLANGYDLQYLFGVACAFSLARLLVRFVVVSRIAGRLALLPAKAGAKKLAPLALWGMIQGVGYLLYNVSDRFLITANLGFEMLAQYSVSAQLATQIHAVASAGVSVLFPIVSRLSADGKLSRFNKMFLMLFMMVAAVTGVGTFILGYWGYEILTLWIDEALASSSAYILFWLSVLSFTQSLSIVSMFILLGLGKAKAIAIVGLAAGLVSFLMMALLVKPYGIYGILMGKGAYCVGLLYLNVVLFRQLREGGRC